MFKTGLYKFKDIEHKNFDTWWNKNKRISINLYPYVSTLPEGDEIAERILLLFSDERGAYKRTYKERFEEFDAIALSYLKKSFSQTDDVRLYDVAVSDGRTALDFFKKISEIFPIIDYVASDYNPTVHILSYKNTKIALSDSGKVLEIVFPPFVFNKIKRDRLLFYPINAIIERIVDHFIVQPCLKKYTNGALTARKLMIFAPTVLESASKNPNFKLTKHNLLQPFKQPADILRAMNILNISYFTWHEFQIVLKNIFEGLKDQGLFITGSNQEAGTTVHGGIYCKKGNQFERLFQSGNGSPIQEMISAFRHTR